MKKKDNKPIIETIINSVALGLTSMGVLRLQGNDYMGFALISFGVGLEWFKYKGRQKNLW
jgi:hypothetical protein